MKKNKLLLVSLLIVPSFSSLFSCNNNVTITLINEDENKGIIGDGKTNKITVVKGNLVQLIAKPNDGYLLTGWYKVISSTEEVGDCFDTTYTFKATENVTYKAKWENYSSQAFNFDVMENGEYKVSRYHGSDTKIIVPATHHGRKVTTIAPRTFIDISYDEIIVSEGITSLQDNVFEGCKPSNQAYVQLPTSLKNLGSTPFYGWDINRTIAISQKNIEEIQNITKTTWGWTLDTSNKIIHASSTCSDKDVSYKIYN